MTTDQAIRDAQARWARRRRRLIGYGQWKPFADAAPVRQHVETIHAKTGMGLRSLSAATGISLRSLNYLMYGDNPHTPPKNIRTETAATLLAYWPTLDDYSDCTLIDPTGTIRRVQALATLGWTKRHIAAQTGTFTVSAIERLKTGKPVTAALARAIRDAYLSVGEKPAEEHGINHSWAVRTRKRATANGWAPPTAWDGDTIDDPDAHPEWTGHCGTDRGYHLHKTEHIPMCPPCEAAHQQWLAEHQHLKGVELRSVITRARGQAAGRGAALAENARELLAQELSWEAISIRLGADPGQIAAALRKYPDTGDQQMEMAA